MSGAEEGEERETRRSHVTRALGVVELREKTPSTSAGAGRSPTKHCFEA